MSKFTVVSCALSECMFYTPEPKDPQLCRCTHPDKAMPMHQMQSRCPLYRVDWQKKVQGATFIPLPGTPRQKPAP